MGLLGKLKEVFSGSSEEQEVHVTKEQSKEKFVEEKQESTVEQKEITEKKPTRMPDSKEAMEADSKKKPIVETLKTIEDPELGIDIWTLGLIYNIDVEEKTVHIRMTFTSIMCPVGPMIVESVQKKVKEVPGIENVKVEVTFNPMWEPGEELREMLGV
jgi:metal-sulfur cluster biosynthetic enzyme